MPAIPAPQGRAGNDYAPSPAEIVRLREKARFVRLETIRLIEIAKVGHYSSVFSAAEIFSALYYDVMKLKQDDSAWPDRDRFLMGKGHAAVGLFPILADLGYLPTEVLNGYTRLGNPLGDHPDMRKVPGIDFSSGSIGHALSAGAGMAWGGRAAGRDFNVFVMLGDGEMQEGQVWEAALFSAHHKLSKLIAIVDRNGFQLDGAVDEVMGVEPLDEKWRSFGWETHLVDGHDLMALTALLRRLRADDTRKTPVCVIARTLKGKGVTYMETEPGWHLGYLAPEDAERAIAEIKSREI
ncbi:transketolase [Methylobacterium nodulans]|uniref:Transketolase domain protein n=1 Tax=Methylobacterium nodulans (strain LMG 21967 / CNCM I-2342 / ORS 2060) TaxID=460265 RepID=B8IQI7_METNO|nr:transketolase [Methylobacterium nodulans]ACL60499.1 Transketolase domain protein [Methylobacterium nodulans ORS 2060]